MGGITQWIAIVISGASMLGGIIHHYLFVKIELERVKTKLAYQESFVNDLRKEISDIHKEISTVREVMSEVKTSIEFLINQRK